MPLGLGGETIGTAFVRVLADGTGLDKSVRDEVDDAFSKAKLHDTGEKHGHDLGDGLAKGFDDEITKGPALKNAVRNMRLSIAKNAHMEKYFESPNWKGFEATMKRRFGDVGELAALEMQAQFIAQGNLEGLAAEQERVIERMKRLKEAAKRKAIKDEEEITRKITALREEQAQRLIQIEKEADDERIRLRQEDMRDAISSAKHRDVERQELEKRRKGFLSFGDTFGEVFGKGSRNDAVNFFGSITQGMANLPNKFAQLAFKIGDFSKAFKGAGGTANFGKSLSAGMEAAGVSASGLAASAAALIPVLLVISSTISLVAGAVVALAGTIAQGLVGAIGVAAGALLPLAAGIGTVVVAYASLSDVQKRVMGQDMKPFTSAFGELADIAGKNIFGNFAAQLNTMVPAIRAMAPAMNSISTAISEQIGLWAQLVSQGGFTSFFSTLQRELPLQIALLGQFSRNLATGLTGLFEGLSPVVSRFLNDITRLTGAFSRWANSVKGNRAITDFFNDAYDATKALGSALLEAGKLIGNLARAGAKFGGNKLFGDLANKMREWSAALTDPANQEAIAEWVRDGAEFARILGRMVMAAFEFIAAWDTPAIRQGINATLNVLIGSFRIFNAVIGFVLDKLGGLIKAASPLLFLADKVGLLGDKEGETKQKTDDFSESLNDLLNSSSATGGELQNTTAMTTLFGDSVVVSDAAMKDAASSANVMGASIKGLIDPVLTAEESLDKLVESTRKLSEQFKGGAGFQGFSAAAIANRDASRQWRNELEQTAAAMQNSGVPVTQDMIDKLKQQSRAFIDEAAASGISREEARKRLEQFNLLPDQIQTRFETPGLKKAREDTDAFIRQLQGKLPKSVLTKIRTEGVPKSIEDVNKLARKLNLTPKQKEILLKVTKADATKNIDEVDRKADEITRRKRGMTITANVPQKKLEDYNKAVKNVPEKTDTTANFNDTVAKQDLSSYTTGLNAIDGKVVNTYVTTNYRTTGKKPAAASGGVFAGPTNVLLGEAGAEAVVPLSRPLGMVDPSVRWLSAIAQGITSIGAGRGSAPSRTIDVGGITVVTPTQDPRAVAQEVVNRLAVAGY